MTILDKLCSKNSFPGDHEIYILYTELYGLSKYSENFYSV